MAIVVSHTDVGQRVARVAEEPREVGVLLEARDGVVERVTLHAPRSSTLIFCTKGPGAPGVGALDRDVAPTTCLDPRAGAKKKSTRVFHIQSPNG